MEQGITVGVDPTAGGASALRWAWHEAATRGVPLTAVRAWLPTAIGAYYPVGIVMPESLDGAVEAQALADEQLKLSREGVPGADSVVGRGLAVLGSPAEVLVDAGRRGALVVVGTRGAGALSRAVLGSVSSSVLHHATGPVVVVPELPEQVGSPTRVLVGVDHSAASGAALRFAVEHARRHGAVLVPVLVREDAWAQGSGAPADEAELALDVALTSLRRAAGLAGAAGLTVRPEVASGQVAAALTALAGEGDVLVLGSRGRGGFATLLLGSTTLQCAQHARCPVIVTRGAEEL